MSALKIGAVILAAALAVCGCKKREIPPPPQAAAAPDHAALERVGELALERAAAV